MRLSKSLRLLRGVGLAATLVLEALFARADGEEPIRARLRVVIAGLQRLVMESISLGFGRARRPDQRFMRIGKAPAAEIRHRIGLAPNDVVEHPEAEVLQCRADAEDVVIGADHPERGAGLHHAPNLREPGAREGIVFGKGSEAIPIVVDRVDKALVGPRQASRKLEIVRRIGEDEIDAARGSFASSATQSPTLTWSSSCSNTNPAPPTRPSRYAIPYSGMWGRSAWYALHTCQATVTRPTRRTLPDGGKGEVAARPRAASQFEMPRKSLAIAGGARRRPRSARERSRRCE